MESERNEPTKKSSQTRSRKRIPRQLPQRCRQTWQQTSPNSMPRWYPAHPSEKFWQSLAFVQFPHGCRQPAQEARKTCPPHRLHRRYEKAMTELTDRQRLFCDSLRTVTNRSTGVRGLSYDAFSGYFTVRYPDGEVADTHTDLAEALDTLLCGVHRFKAVDPATVFAVIEYLGLNKFAR